MVAMTAAGTTLAITAGVPATQDVAGAAALTYTKISNVESIGAIGASREVVNFQPLDGPLQKYKGPSNSGSLTPAIAHDDADAGQTLVRTASADASQKLYWMLVTLPDGAKRYFGSRVFGYPENIGAANAMLMANPVVEICTDVIKAPAA